MLQIQVKVMQLESEFSLLYYEIFGELVTVFFLKTVFCWLRERECGTQSKVRRFEIKAPYHEEEYEMAIHTVIGA